MGSEHKIDKKLEEYKLKPHKSERIHVATVTVLTLFYHISVDMDRYIATGTAIFFIH